MTAPRRVSLPMYNLPEMRPVNAAFWVALRTELARRGLDDLPEAPDFTRAPVPERIEPDTLVTQVCGYPLQTIYAGQARHLAVPVYAAEGCEGADHAGVFVVHRDSRFQSLGDLRGSRFVFNSVHSNSGMNLPRRALADLAGGRPFLGSVEETHSQPANLERVARGEAEATCVDCVTNAFFRRHRPGLGDLTRPLAYTPPSPAIPFVTAAATPEAEVALLREALAAVGRAPEWSEARAGLMIADILPPDPARYAIQLDYGREAAALGYPALA
ncbi:PhnD/SsuA/transferrin family substrate-binding protein [Belnapia sp. T6]|uniref:PhnD/SsuA/transferrin family substrate-binding protein n=1 Tax=Belnapia mucosa TaxID=2804532 RepID=A0ABS1V4F9_9PROT|nr:PhnD/SsuA/transferrin family substrate-binding protein [Belnapia mucosa]MBL6456588.1 PhnD/SsuA/transferrin family substrate-binding protein [Belnapia mucosa]